MSGGEREDDEVDEIRIDEQRLPGVGVRYELVLRDGHRLVVTAERAGDRHLALGAPSREEPIAAVALDQREALAVAALLLGARFSVGGPTTDPAVTVRAIELGPRSPVLGMTAAQVVLPDPDAVVLAALSDTTPEVVEDEHGHRLLPGDRLVVAARGDRLDAIARALTG